MRDYYLKTEPLTFLAITKLTVNREINTHGTAVLEGYIADEDEERFLGQLQGQVWEKIEETGRDEETTVLFWGLVTGFSIQRTNDQKRMTLELTTGTCLMDLAPHFRTFQDGSMDYSRIFRQITENYPNAGMIKNIPLSNSIKSLVMQYQETDWEFLKRMAGRHRSFLVPASSINGTKYFVDLPKGKTLELPADARCSIRKDMQRFLTNRSRGLSGLRESACTEYIVESREDCRIGDQIMFQGQPFFIYRIRSRYQGGEMLHTCYLMVRAGLDMPEETEKDRAGCAFQAEVLNVKEDKVQVRILKDENRSQNITFWYPYATVYSTPDGTGWYCMPEIGDQVRLYLPSDREQEAYVFSAVHLDTESTDRKDPEHKIIKNRYQKEIRFTPDSIILTNNQGTRIALTDADGIQITSSHSVVIRAKDQLTLSSEKGSLTAAGTEAVSLQQKTTGIRLEEGISFIGGELKVQ